MSVTEKTKEEVAEEPQLQKDNEQDDETQIDKDEKGQNDDDDDEGIPNGGGGNTGVNVDHDAQEMVISSLRTQIQDLFSQVNQLNNKLVRSYDRVSDLEDSLHVTTTNLQLSNQKVNHLELEKSQHLSQVTSGSLVERSHVTAELTRLMERATEEAAHRGQAESAKDKIEKELEELSASLFGEANRMVEEARVARSLSERKVEEAEGRLREAEDAVRIMQTQMQTLMQEKEDVERNPAALTTTTNPVEGREQLMKNHLAYHEYLAFLAHLRNLHVANPTSSAPAMATLLQLPFLSRLLNEDSEPTLRLDLAPSLNWLSRRSVLSAIHTGQLSVEPISTGTLFTLSMESPFITIAGMSPSSLNLMTAKPDDLEINITCALCGSSIFHIDTTSMTHSSGTLTPHFAPHTTWSAAAGSFFRKPSIPLSRALSSTSTINGVSTNGTSTPPDTAPSSSTATIQSIHPVLKSKHPSLIPPQTQIHIFRLASLPSATSSALSSFSLPLSKASSLSSSSHPIPPPMSTSASGSSSRPASSASLTSSSTTVASLQPTTFYPLCNSGWCLARLRATCTLWSFIRTGIVEKVWDEEVILPIPHSVRTSPSRTPSSSPTATSTPSPVGESSKSRIGQSQQRKAPPPPLPPRRRGLWGIASALGERAASWGEGTSKEKRESRGFPLQSSSNEKLMPGGGRHDKQRNNHPEPALNLSSAERTESALSSSSTPPPPLPKRSVNRSRGENNSPSPTSRIENPTRQPPTGPTDAIHTANSSLSRAVNIPLPESRAGTPLLLADVKINGGDVDSTPTLSRTSSLAGGALPPPVPRRAAARSKGVITILDGTKVGEKEEKAGTTEGVITSADSQVDEMAKEGGTVPEEEEKQDETAKPTSGEAKTVAAEEEKLEVADKKKTDDLIISKSEGVESNGGMNGVNKTVEEGKESRLEEPLTEKSPLPDAHPDEYSTEPGSVTADTGDVTQYVGTSTWEEKMWRELVRIRKEMFYARIGAANS